MANDSSMKNISQVEEYVKLVKFDALKVEDIFSHLKRKTDEIGQNWNDRQFQQFQQVYNDVIMKQIKGTCETLLKLSVYAKKQCEFNRMAEQHKFNV